MEASSEQDECCKWTLVLQQGCHGISQVLVKYYYYLERSPLSYTGHLASAKFHPANMR